jgi:hypothetical protein
MATQQLPSLRTCQDVNRNVTKDIDKQLKGISHLTDHQRANRNTQGRMLGILDLSTQAASV